MTIPAPTSAYRTQHNASNNDAFQHASSRRGQHHKPLTEAQQSARDAQDNVREALAQFHQDQPVARPPMMTRNISGKLGSQGYSHTVDFTKLPKVSDVTFLKVLNDLCYEYYRLPLKALRGSASLLTMLHEVTIVEIADTKYLEAQKILRWEDMGLESGTDKDDGKFFMSFNIPECGEGQYFRIVIGSLFPTHQLVVPETPAAPRYTY
ncbi:hypothetical protein Illi2_00106 [Pseudomonas phage vB_PpuM-Illi-2]